MCKPSARVMARYWDKVHKSKRREQPPLLPISARLGCGDQLSPTDSCGDPGVLCQRCVTVDKTKIFPKGGFVAAS